MKKVLFLSFITLQSSSLLFSQQVKTKPDTMSIMLNGEHIVMPVPKEGNKTTINLEDSASIIQISVAKTSKFKTAATSAKTPETELRRKHVSWFNEVDFGLKTLVAKSTVQVNDTAYGFNFSTGSGTTNNRATVIKLTPKTINPGFSVGFTIREKRRPIGKSNFTFITGSRFRYSRYTSKGQYDISEIKATYKDGVPTYFPDSVYSTKSGEYRTTNSSYQFLFPFLIETHLKSNENFKFAVGLNLALNIHSSKFTENVRSSSSIIIYSNPQLLQFQPIIKASYKRTSVYLSYTTGKTRIGSGSTQTITGNTMYFGLAYKLY